MTPFEDFDPVISENPFSPSCSRAAFLETGGAGEALRRLDAGLGAREPFLLLTGEPGTGKTTLVHEAVARWESRVTLVILGYPALTEKELLEEMALRFGGEPAEDASRPRLMMCLEECLAEIAKNGHSAMVVVDQAQRWPVRSLNELFLVVNAVQQARLPLEVLLVGAPELETLLEDSTLAPLRERLSVRARLEPFSSGETRRYLRHRSDAAGENGANLFPRRICLEIAALTGGIARRIDALAGEALRIARQNGEGAVEVDHLYAATDRLSGKPAVRAATEADDDESPPPSIATNEVAVAPAKAAAVEPATERTERPVVRPDAVHAERREPSAPRRDPAPAEATSVPAPPTSHDAGEWISRFVGDQGPIRIGSQVTPLSASAVESDQGSERNTTRDAAPSRAKSEATSGRASETRSTPPSSNGNRNQNQMVLSAVAAIVVVGALALVMRAGNHPTQSRHPVAVATTASRPSSAKVVAATKSRRAGIVPVPTADSSDASNAAATDSAQADAEVTSPTHRYTVAVGEFSDLQAAFDERDRIYGLTGMDTWVVQGTGDLGPHRVVLGIYRSRERAEAAARMLVNSHTLDAASVVPLPPRSARQ